MARATAGVQFYSGDNYVFTEASVNLLLPGDFDGLDIVIGQTADEYTGLRGVSPMTPEEQREALMTFIREYQVGPVDESVLPLDASNDPVETSRFALRAINDYMFQYVRLGAEIARRNSKHANVYLYYWNHWPPGQGPGSVACLSCSGPLVLERFDPRRLHRPETPVRSRPGHEADGDDLSGDLREDREPEW